MKNTGGPAFPQQGLDPWKNPHQMAEGMTLRDYFAAKAMQAQLARTTWGIEDAPLDMAQEAYSYADAMLKAREE